ncbi:sharpin [Sylvia borin]
MAAPGAPGPGPVAAPGTVLMAARAELAAPCRLLPAAAGGAALRLQLSVQPGADGRRRFRLGLRLAEAGGGAPVAEFDLRDISYHVCGPASHRLQLPPLGTPGTSGTPGPSGTAGTEGTSRPEGTEGTEVALRFPEEREAQQWWTVLSSSLREARRAPEGDTGTSQVPPPEDTEQDPEEARLLELAQTEELALRLAEAVALGDEAVAAQSAVALARRHAELSVTLRDRDRQGTEISLSVVVEDATSSAAVTLRVQPHVTIATLKEQVFRQYGFPAAAQRWIIGQSLCRDGRSLGSYGVRGDGDTAFLFLLTAKAAGLGRERQAHSLLRAAGLGDASPGAAAGLGDTSPGPGTGCFIVSVIIATGLGDTSPGPGTGCFIVTVIIVSVIVLIVVIIIAAGLGREQQAHSLLRAAGLGDASPGPAKAAGLEDNSPGAGTGCFIVTVIIIIIVLILLLLLTLLRAAGLGDASPGAGTGCFITIIIIIIIIVIIVIVLVIVIIVLILFLLLTLSKAAGLGDASPGPGTGCFIISVIIVIIIAAGLGDASPGPGTGCFIISIIVIIVIIVLILCSLLFLLTAKAAGLGRERQAHSLLRAAGLGDASPGAGRVPEPPEPQDLGDLGDHLESLQLWDSAGAPPTAPEPRPPSPEQGWPCPRCTFLNKPTRPGCEMCSSPRPEGYRVPGGHRPDPAEQRRLQREQDGTRQCQQALEAERQRNFQQLLRAEREELVPNPEALECGICLQPVAAGRGVLLRDCLHSFCRECLRQVIEHSEEPAVPCPYRDVTYACDSHLQDREIRALLSPEEHARFLARGLALAERRCGDSFHCRRRDCPGWCFTEDTVNEFPCPVCGALNCLVCKAIHEGQDCRQYQDELQLRALHDAAARQTRDMLQTLVQRGEAMHCPTCRIVVQKKDGCDWIRCTVCHTEICWVTKGPRWGPAGPGDTSGGCRCNVNGQRCHPQCQNCH